MSTMTIAERVAENQNAFRTANEQIEVKVDRIASDLELLPFICECPQPRCTEIVRLKRHEYENVRRRGNTFLVAPGHETVEVDGTPVARVGHRFERYSLMVKIGEAAKKALELDPRGT
jgi:hypothetical protein